MRRDFRLSTAHARVRFTIEVPAGSIWGADCALSQIYQQAGEETANKLSGHLKSIGAKIVGQPEVIAVFATENADD